MATYRIGRRNPNINIPNRTYRGLKIHPQWEDCGTIEAKDFKDARRITKERFGAKAVCEHISVPK